MKAHLVSKCFVNDFVSQVDILFISVIIESCGSNISQLLNVIENSIDWCIDIKSHMFDHICIVAYQVSLYYELQG